MKHLKLIDNCELVDWDVSLLYNLESIEIGNECFGSVRTFQIDGLNRLKTIKIESNHLLKTIKIESNHLLRKRMIMKTTGRNHSTY